MTESSSDWVEILEPRSRERMYVNLATGECGWEVPPGVAVRQSDGKQWWELFDSSNNRFYYYNIASQQTVWHRPQGCDVVPLAQLQAMKRNSESDFRAQARPCAGEGRWTPQPGAYPSPPASQDLDDCRRDTTPNACDGGQENRREPRWEPSQRWQPAPGSKAAMLVKVNSSGRSQSSSNTIGLIHVGKSGATKSVYQAQPERVHSFSKMAMPGDPKQAFHFKKSERDNIELGLPSRSTSPFYQTPHHSQASTPQSFSAKYGASPPPIYDEPPREAPIYDEPPVEMEVEGACLVNRPSTLPYSPAHSQPKCGQSSVQTKLLQYPASLVGSKHRMSPTATEYSPAGRECIKHMVNVDPAAPSKLSISLPQSPVPSNTSEAAPISSSAQALGHKGAAGTAGPQREVSLEKKHSWRLLDAAMGRSMEGRHSRQSSLASQEYPGPAAVTYQDSGYSTGPSPSLRRKNRRRPPGPGMGSGVGMGAQQGRIGSVGSSSELNMLSEKLMAEMRAAVSRSNTLNGSKASLDTEVGSEGSISRTRSPICRMGSREDVTSSNRSLYRANHGDLPLSPLTMEGFGRQKRTYEKVDSMEKSVHSQTSLLSPEAPTTPSQAGTLDSKAQSDISQQGDDGGKRGGTGSTVAISTCGGGGAGAGGGYQYPYATICKSLPDANMVDWASKNLNLHTQGLFRRRLSIANMLSWNGGSIKKPMLITSDRVIKKEACEMFKLVQAYMGDRSARLDRRHAALTVVTKCWALQGLRDELYVQLVRQTTDNLSLRSLQAGWELMAVSLAFFSPSPKFRRYLEGYIQRHVEPSNDKKVLQYIQEQQDMKNKKNSKSRKKRKQNNEPEEKEGLPISTYAKYCYRKLQKVAITGGKKGLRKPTLEEIDHGRNAIVTPSLFGSALEEIIERQSQLFPERRLPWVQVQLSQYVLGLGGAQTEGIFRVPGDIDEVNALKLQVDQWKIPENLSDPNVPASLLKLWYRELEEPVIPQGFYSQCISNYEDPEAAISVVQALPELNRLVLCYFIHFLQVFAQPVNVSKTKMDVNNLAMVMAPNCLRCQSDDPRVIFENTRKEMSFLRMLIVHLDTSFIKGII
ncbi:rho GTPase-activating protein 39 isoform X2 [Denticeps clupeoides]|uniref:Rho GTPase-activating protein 39 n=1 Tax=Denticeps clupeoides TaxID=299321 RepID=A0AAY4CTX7_9TELE|nr:rho GTPase-activating protein 39-like isoform X2 [Denticeps clupeoides]